MSYFDDASLVMIPSGYKDQKVYSVKPIDGSGDLTFSRASNATRVNSSGLVEKVRTNLALYSEDQTNAAWTKTNVSVTGDTTANPVNGATTADTFTITTQTTVQGLSQSFTADGSIYTISVFLKKEATSKTISLKIRDSIGSGTTYATADLNLNTGVVSAVSGVASVVDYDANWWRLIVTTSTAPAAGTRSIVLRVANVAVSETFTIFGAMLEKGDIATDYIATTTTAVSVGPVSGLPRLDYSGGASCPSLLLEPQATALNQYSESFDNAYWTKNAATIVANNAISPDGYQNADLLYPTSAGVSRYVLKFVGATSGLAYTTSVFAKASGKNWLGMANVDSGSTTAWFNLSTGTVGTVLSGTTAKIESYANGWYRCSVTRTAAATTGAIVLLVEDADNSDNVTPNGTDGILIWGCNLTQTAYVQSYIPTLSSAVTRVADAASKTGISSLIGQTEGTIFVEFTALDTTDSRITLSDGTSANRLILRTHSSGKVQWEGVQSGSDQWNIETLAGQIVLGNTYKIAAAYGTNNVALYMNGVQLGIDNVASVTNALSVFRFASASSPTLYTWAQNINQALLFKTRLSNADLATLTA